MMRKLLDGLRRAARQFLGLNSLATLPDDQAYRHIGQQLLQVQRIFGDPARVTVGRDVILNDALINTSSGTVTLEDFVFCGHGVSLLTGTHDYRQVDHQRQAGVPGQGHDIVVGQGAWLGSNATLLGPCRIGRDAVIAAGAVVVGDIEAGSIYAGVPARRIASIEFAGAAAPAGEQP